MKDDGGPAFPMPSNLNEHGVRVCESHGGMSLHDYFAAAALQGLLADVGKLLLNDVPQKRADRGAVACIVWANWFADSMIQAKKENSANG